MKVAFFAERLGFEPRVPVRVRRISSAVHSTTLASLRLRLQNYNFFLNSANLNEEK